MEEDKVCPQCKKSSDLPTSRLVQDACGHKKCRLCLLNDEIKCKMCQQEEDQCSKLEKCDIREVELNGKDFKTEVENTTNKCDKRVFTNNACNIVNKSKNDISECDKMKIEDKIDINNETGTPKKIGKRKTAGNVKRETAVIKYQNCDSVQDTTVKTDLKKYNSSSQAMPSHIIVNQSDNVKSYSCNICKKTFTTRSHIRYHSYCGGVKKPFQCDICKKDFIVKSHLQSHILSHNKTKPYSCDKCDKSFAEKSKLNRHKLSHSDEKGYVCTECGKSFKNKENLRTHSLTHKPEKPFGCTECNKRFSHSSNLKKHIGTHLKEKAHMCDQCGKRFKIKWALNVHRKVHSKNRPYECKTCDKNFLQVKDLHRHELIHLEVKSFVCGICGTDFKRKDNLHRHTKNSHPGRKTIVAKGGRKIPPKIPANLPKKSIEDTPNAVNVITAPPTLKFDIPKMPKLPRNTPLLPPIIPKLPDLPPIVSDMPALPRSIPKKAILPPIPIPKMCILPQIQRNVFTGPNLPANNPTQRNLPPINTSTIPISQPTPRLPTLSTIPDMPVLPAGIPKKPILPPCVPKMNILPPSAPKLHKLPPVIYKMPSYPPKMPNLPPIIQKIPNLPSSITNLSSTPNIPNISNLPKQQSTTPVINAPLKLAFKTSAFKNYYNIHRDYVEPTDQKSVYEKILTSTPIRTKSIIRTLEEEKQDASNAICQRILYPFSGPLHYATSFYNERHGSIKNIKFKLPANYTNLKCNTNIKEAIDNLQLSNNMLESNSSNGDNESLKSPSVIVNTNQHWRRRAAHFFTTMQDS